MIPALPTKRLLSIAALLLALSLPAHACPFCRDAVAGSNPHLQQGFRKAIPVLGVPAVALFTAMLCIVATSRTNKDRINGDRTSEEPALLRPNS